jgi:hypothetical protein
VAAIVYFTLILIVCILFLLGSRSDAGHGKKEMKMLAELKLTSPGTLSGGLPCGANIGEHHTLGCHKEPCPYCGGQLLVCRLSRVHDPSPEDRLVWDGYFPGEREAAENGWIVKPGLQGLIPCSANDPDPRVVPDLNKVRLNYRWSREGKAWVKT